MRQPGVRRRMRSLSALSRERGSVAWVVIMVVLFFMLVTLIVNATVSGAKRSQQGHESQLLTQRTESAVAAAISALTVDPAAVPATRDDALSSTGTVDCQTINGRPVCYAYWALPVPGQAVEPVRYNVVSNAWVDTDGDRLPPASDYRASLVTVEAITYQNDVSTEGLYPKVHDAEGYVAYPPTALGLFGNAIHGFTRVQLNGSTDGSQATRVDVSSYNSLTGMAGTHNAVVSSDGTVSYAARTKADRTVLYGGASNAGDFTERCTGEACKESDVRVLVDTHIKPTDVSMRWMDTAACATHTGDWRASEHGGKLPVGSWCIDGNLIIDAPTDPSGPNTTLFVRGNILIEDHLNAPDAAEANPGSLVIYSTARTVTFDVPATGTDGTGIAALLYAPLATCGNNVAGNGLVKYYGSLVCDVVSISGPWEHQWDEAGSVALREIVPGASKVWTLSPTQKIDEGTHHTPEGWDRVTCVAPRPVNAWGWWKLDERLPSTIARNSAGTGTRDGAWSSVTAARPEGVCGQGAAMTPTGAFSYPTVVPGSTQNGATVEYWAKNAVGTIFEGAGIKVEHIDTNKVRVTAGGTTNHIPFTVQNFDRWHLFTVTFAPDGTARLYVDGQYKDWVQVGAIAAAGSPIQVGVAASGAPAGAIDEVVYYERQLPTSPTNEVKQRWDAWSRYVDTTTIPSPGTPFTAPSGLRDAGSTHTAVNLAWTAATGTLPSGQATYQVEYSAPGGAVAAIGAPVPVGTVTARLEPPPLGTFHYRVCTVYNGDQKCSTHIEITTITLPAAPTVTVSNITHTTALFSWNTPQFTERYESQYRTNNGAWSTTLNHALTQKSITHGPTTQGTKIDVRVRGVNVLGAGPWSTVSTGQLTVSGSNANGMNTESVYPVLRSRLVYSAGPICPAGITPQIRFRDQVTTWGGTWNGWGGWINGVAGSNVTAWAESHIASLDVGANQRLISRCANLASGAVGPEWGEHNPGELWHPINNPWSVAIGVPSYRTLSWQAGCQGGTQAWFRYQVVGAFNTGVRGPTTATSDTSLQGQAWGKGTAYLTAYCQAPGGRRSGEVHATVNFG